MTDTTQSTGQVIAQTAVQTAEQLMPVLLAALSAGAAAGAPQAALVQMVAAVIPPLVQSFGMTSTQVKQLLDALQQQIALGQAQIQAAAAARGITDPTIPAAPNEIRA